MPRRCPRQAPAVGFDGVRVDIVESVIRKERAYAAARVPAAVLPDAAVDGDPAFCLGLPGPAVVMRRSVAIVVSGSDGQRLSERLEHEAVLVVVAVRNGAVRA